MNPSGLNLQADPAENHEIWTPGMSAKRGTPNNPGNRPPFLGVGAPNIGWQNLAGIGIAGGNSPITPSTLISGCSTSKPNAMHESSTPRIALSGSMNLAAEQHAGRTIRPSCNLPAGCTQVPINILVFHRRLTGRASRPQLPLSHSFMTAPALPGVSEDSENGASIQLARSEFLSLGRASNIVASDMEMNPSGLATPDKYSLEHSMTHFRPSGLGAEASQTVFQEEDSQQPAAAAATAVICASHSKLESAIPANTEETQGQHPGESTGQLAEGLTDSNIHKYQGTQKKSKAQSNQSDHTILSTPAVFKERTLTQIEMQISGAEKTETFQNEKEETPAQKAKPRRKKHRPKVIREDKPAKKQKAVVTTPEVNTPNQKAKRSYAREKRNFSSLEKCSGSVIDQLSSRETENAARSRTASVRRRLQFEFGEQGVQEDQSSTGNSFHHNQEKIIHAKSFLCSVNTSAVQIGHGLQVDMENSPGEFAFGMSRKLNELLDEYIHSPDIAPKPRQEISPATSGCFSRELARKQDNVGSSHDPDATRMSGLCIKERMGVTVMEGSKNLEMNYSNIDVFNMHHSCTEIKSTKSQMTKVSKVEKKNHAQHNDNDSSLTGIRDSIILRTAAEMLAFCQAGGVKKKRSVRVRRNSFVPIMDIEKYTSQALTTLPQSCMEALYESSCIKFMTKKRSQKAQLRSPSSIHPNTNKNNMFSSGSIFSGGSNGTKESEGSFWQTKPQAPDKKRINLDIYCEVPERSAANTSTVPYMDYLQGVASKLKQLDLNNEHAHRTDMHSSLTTPAVVSFGGIGELSNALVPYGSRIVLPFERPLHLVKKQRPRAKVNLDFETTRVWNLLMGKAAEPVDGTDVEKERWWQQEREVFQGRANSFIARMRLVQGDRHFSPWKGSVVDSVVGVFLTQNVSDHLSSSAYMALAASFPPGSVNSNCKEDVTTQDNEEIISMSPVGNKSMLDFFDNGARPDLGVNFEDLSINYEKIHVETKENTSYSDLAKGENYSFNSFNSKEPNEGFCKCHLTDIDHEASTRSLPEIQFEKEMPKPSSQSVVTSETIFQSTLSLSTGKNSVARNFVGCVGITASQQLGSNFDDGNSLVGNDATTNETECQRIKTAVINDDGVGKHEIPSTSMMYPYISTAHRPQLDVRNEPYVSSTSPNSSSGSASPHLKNGTIEKEFPSFMPFDTHAAQRNGNKTVVATLNPQKMSTELPVKLHYDKRTSFEASNLLEHESISATGGMVAETASKADEPTLKPDSTSYNGMPEKAAQTSRPKKTRTPNKKNMENLDWDKFRRQACNTGHMKERIFERRDSVDWEAVRCADVQRISHAIRERGMNNILAERIQSFLNRLVRDHGSIDLEWLREIPPESAKDYLLSIRGLGLKSVECVRLLTLHHLAFPVDTNVGRICVRLGWVPIQPLPESLQLHLLELYPVLETIQKYLWPRLCKLDQHTLYELHYHMITFGKVFCTKSKPNCNACPMRSECKHFASAFASARLALPAPQEKSLVKASNQFGFQNVSMTTPNLTALPQLEGSVHVRDLANNSEPIIEEPASPREEECLETLENDIEDFDDGEIPTIKLNMEVFAENLENCIKESNKDLQSDDIAKALVAISTEAASIPLPKLKNVHRLRTEHYVYELPDSHPLVQQLGLDQREPDDPSPYLLTIWMSDEINETSKSSKTCCESQMEGGLCNNEMCSYCVPKRENQSRYVRGTILVPCRTAMRGSFPLNGTYFQVNEVFADHKSSHDPIHVSREQLWKLQRRMVYFGTSVPTIFKGLTTEEVQQCFWRGFVCVRGFDMETKAPRPLCPHLHLAASKLRSRKTEATEKKL